METEKTKESFKSFLKQLLLRHLLKIAGKVIWSILSTVGFPIIATLLVVLVLFVIVWGTFFQIPKEYQMQKGSLGFFSTFDAEWNLEKDMKLMEEYQDLTNNGLSHKYYAKYAAYFKAPSGEQPNGDLNEDGSIDTSERAKRKYAFEFGSKKGVPYQPSEHAQASEFKLSYGDNYGGNTVTIPVGTQVTIENIEGANYDVRHITNVSPEQLNARLGGALAGLGDYFVQYGTEYGVDPLFLAALAMHESGNGTNRLARELNNFGSRKALDGSWMKFATKEEGVRELAKYIQRKYISKGVTTLAGIQNIYAPLSDSPLNANWIPGIYRYMTGFGVNMTDGESMNPVVGANGPFLTGNGTGSGWALLGAIDRMIGDPILGDKKARKPDPKKVYFYIGPRFKWKKSHVTVTSCDEEGKCTTETYECRLLIEADQYDKLNKISYAWETFSPSKGVTVTREKRVNVEVKKYPVTRLQGWFALYGLELETDLFAFELAARYDDVTNSMVAGNTNVPDFIPADGKGFSLPVAPGTYRLSSGYGYRIHPTLGYKKFHSGVDLAAPEGTPIYAAAGGVVTFAGTQNGYGYCVEINHGAYRTFYAHIKAGGILVQPGQTVAAGQKIALVGSTGRSTGPHLHFEVRKYEDGASTTIAPTKFFKF
ncbi:peptidoglycan DD-metalloendopeptidase family protein [Aneurinibacillus thermoaerophilus]|uniref:peptidoglycan DD-metalloendopeptidase family protein n=1 Tax=Aneurinibacillus thermoaerophilus TaxID=143495 RepID=UPI002E1E72C4|nr:peptidoglycan DD-metalloendopeptidase family protein [Aneurinibacillus thermoaerophilus]